MSARLLIAAAVAALALALAAAAPAAAPLKYQSAVKRAQAEAARQQQRQPAIVAWEISRGYRFTSAKFVFPWYADLNDGTSCSGQLVVRFASSKSRKLVSYFRNVECA